MLIYLLASMATGSEKLPPDHRAKASMIDDDENFSWLRAGEENVVGALCNFCGNAAEKPSLYHRKYCA